MALLILALLQRIFLMSSLLLLLGWLIFFMVLIKLLPILGTISGKTVKLMVLALICLGNNRQDCNPPKYMFSCLQILEAFLWFVLIPLLNVTLIILTLSVSRLLNLLLRLVAFLLFLNPQGLASISIWITASSSWKRFCLFVCRALSSIMLICFLFNDTATTEIYTLSLHDALPISPKSRSGSSTSSTLRNSRSVRRKASSSSSPTSDRKRSEEHTSELQSRLHLVCRLLLEKKKNQTTRLE